MRHMVGISGRQDGDQFLLDELEDGFGFEPPQKKGLCLSAQSGKDEQLPCNERGVHDDEQAVVRTDAFEDILCGLARLQEGILTVHNALGLSRASRRERDGAEHVRSWPVGGIVDSLLLRNEGIEAVGVRRAVGQRHAHN